MSWLPEETRQVTDNITVTYLRSQHGHEGAHDVTLYGHELRILPTPATTARKRYRGLVDAIGAIDGQTSMPPTYKQIDPVAYVVGSLVVAGAYRLLLDGQPLIPVDDAGGVWRLELAHAGQVRATYIGDTDE